MLPLRTILILFCALRLAVGSAQEALRLSPDPGFYAAAVEVSLGAGSAGAIHFTTDGSRPTQRSSRYRGTTIKLDRSAVIRAVRFENGEAIATAGGTYLIDEPDSELLTVSLGIDPGRLFHRRNGWFVEGDDPDDPNWNTHREHPAQIDIFESDGTRVHAGIMGFRMFGGASRSHPQKSFSLSGRESYGNKRIDYPLFGADGEQDFRFVVLRNGGSDWGRSFLRDALLTGLLRDRSWTLDVQDARPAQVYINGQYWGIYHLREKINPRFLEDHHPGVDKDSLSLLEHEESVKHGRGNEYGALRSFIRTADLRDPAAYARLGEMMDIDNFQQLQIAQTYFDNHDAGGNIRYWRPDGPNERFRWILYDVDQGFGLHQSDGWLNNTLKLYTADDGPAWPNPPWSTLFHRKLLANEGYRRHFVNRSLDYLHTDFSTEAVTERIESTVSAIGNEMPRQLARWDLRPQTWTYHIDQLRRFALYRPQHLREQYREYFNGGEDRTVSLSASLGGFVVLNENMQVGTDGLKGSYFANFPLTVRAVPEPGFRFTGWEESGAEGDSLTLDLTENRPYRLTATFEAARHPAADQLVINEICAKSSGADDWLELYNRGEQSIDLTGWFLVDGSGKRFVLPKAVVAPGNYLVVCKDRRKFARAHPEVRDYVGELPFGLNKSEDRVGLYAADGAYVNALSYRLVETADSSFTYALALPGLDNTRHRNWVQEAGNGTPGRANPGHLQTIIMSSQRFWVRIGIGLAVLLVVGVVRTLHGEA
ncbi:CotH kinase family protein [Neolewinella xylanilytica]|uniref:CotH kinase family protein n=1 Tax=Neolewinella xylanilytica TaxID=1514080 RepID=UPI0011B08F56|nr:CotH kinase family protein [Neolewinella xylanilytica]